MGRRSKAMKHILIDTNLGHLDIVIPARLQGYMSGCKPVLAMIGSGAAEVINDADCGYVVSAGDFKSLAELIQTKVLADMELAARKGANGRAYFEKYFTKSMCIDKLIGIVRGHLQRSSMN
ncbi:MAG: hypothetical protein KBT27_16415 [Prevotellaceae bacterium]|nr:hypothetical protein [Candidatus Faecinaster equi]